MKIETNADDVAKSMDVFAKTLFPATEGEVEEFAGDTERDAKTLAPVGRTRTLRNAIISRVDMTPFRIVASFGWEKEGFYGIFWEYGTRKLGARPHIRPAFDKNAPGLLRRINGMIDRRWTK